MYGIHLSSLDENLCLDRYPCPGLKVSPTLKVCTAIIIFPIRRTFNIGMNKGPSVNGDTNFMGGGGGYSRQKLWLETGGGCGVSGSNVSKLDNV